MRFSSWLAAGKLAGWLTANSDGRLCRQLPGWIEIHQNMVWAASDGFLFTFNENAIKINQNMLAATPDKCPFIFK